MTTARTPLLGLALLLLYAAPALGSKDDTQASSLIEQARHLSDIRSEGSAPFQLRMNFRVIQRNGKVDEGVYTELWVSKAQWRRETDIGPFRRIEVGVGRKRWLLDSSTVLPEHISDIPHISEFGSFPGKWKAAKDREINGVSAHCIEQKSGFGSSTLCFAKANGTIAAEFQPWQLNTRIGEKACSYSDYEKYGDRMFAKSYECEGDKQPLLQARILELTAAPAEDSSLFAPPNGAKELVNCFDSVKPAWVLSAPNLPPPTQSFNGTIVVLVSTVIGTDGRTHNLKVVSEPRQPFDETALEQVRQWRFTPAKCGGESMETEIVVQVAFTHY